MRDGRGRWRTIEHTADLAVEVEAPSLPELFVTAAAALVGVMRGEEAGGGGVAPEGRIREWREISLAASDRGALLVEWLREMLFLAISVEPLFFVGAEIAELDDTRLVARAALSDGELAERVERELKGVTYHDLEVGRRGEGWFARVVFDV